MHISFLSSLYYVKWYKWYENIACKPASLPMSFSLFPLFLLNLPLTFCSVLWLYSQYKGIHTKTLWNERTISLSCSVLKCWIKITHEATSAISPNERHHITRRKFSHNEKTSRKREKKLKMYFQCSLPAVVIVIFCSLFQSYNMLKREL